MKRVVSVSASASGVAAAAVVFVCGVWGWWSVQARKLREPCL